MGALGLAFEDGSQYIHQIFLYGNGARPYLLAVVVPTEEALATYDASGWAATGSAT